MLSLTASVTAVAEGRLVLPNASVRVEQIDVSAPWSAQAGPLQIVFLADIRPRLGLDFQDRDGERLLLEPGDNNLLRFTAPYGALEQVLDGRIELEPALVLTIAGKAHRLSAPALVPGPDARSAFRLVDAEGRIWLELRNAHDRMDPVAGELEFFNMGVVVGPHLAGLLGDSRLAGTLFGVGTMPATVSQRPDRAILPSSCDNPNWPSPATPGDVALTGLGGYQMMRGIQADGPGGQDGQVVVAPSALLKNVGTRDMPWHGKFTGIFPPYNNDQHPLLVWAMYRMDPDGSLVQYGKSGIKHAFLTINDNCTEPCAPGNVLGLGCEDLYDATTNDVPSDSNCPGFQSCTLGPRSELVPRTAIWGRCGSIYDQNCDGNPSDTQAYGPFDHRLIALESEFDPAANPGSVQWFEGWYIVRDDAELFNNMGSTTIVPAWILSSSTFIWNFNAQNGPFTSGPVIDRWLAAAPTPFASLGSLIDSPEGRAKLAVRVRAVPGGYRYDYALANFDFARAVVSGSNPNFRVERTPGFSALTIAGANAVSNVGFRDADRDPGNQWQATPQGDALRWQAPGAQHLPWGTLYSFSFHSNDPPVAGTATVTVAETGTPGQFQVPTLVPDSRLFRDGFEDP